MKTAIRPLRIVAALAAVVVTAQIASAQTTVDIPATDNAFGTRSAADTVQGVTQTLTTKRLNDSNCRIAYARFNVSAYTAAVNNIQSAILRLYVTGGTGDTVRVYGLTNSNINSVSDSAWTSATLTFNNQPAKTAAPNDIPSATTALPNANTTGLLGSQTWTTIPGEVDITLSLADFQNFLANDNNGEITLIWHNTANNNVGWASTFNTGGNLVPTLELVVIGGGGGPTISGTNVWKGTADGTIWDTTAVNWATLGGAQTNYLQSSYAIFDDTAGNNTNIILSTTITNGGILVSNTSAHYVWTGGNNIVGQGGLTKKNSGTFIVANSIANTFSGGVDLQAGTIQVGNGNTDLGAGNLGNGPLTNSGVLLVNMGSGGTVTLANAISGSGTFTNIGAGTLTLSGPGSYTSGLQIQAGAVRANSPGSLGAATAFVNTNATLVLGAATTNSLTVANATLGVANADFVLNTNAELMITADTTNILQSGDPQLVQANSRNLQVDGKLRGSGTILVKNAANTFNPDGASGVRFRETVASDFTGLIIVTNNAKSELQVVGAGPFSPVNTGKFQLYCGAYNGSFTLTATDPGGYPEFNVRNNSSGNASIGNDIELVGSGAVVFNAIGSAPNGSVDSLGNLKAGDTQEVIGYRGAGAVTNAIQFGSVTLTGGTVTFSPHSSSFGLANQAGTDFILNNVTESSASGITMNGLGTLALTGTSTYTGSTAVQQGKMLINGFKNGSGTITAAGGATLGGNGTNAASVQVDGTLAPGNTGAAGTFGAGGLVLNGILAFDIGANNTIGNGVNDLVKVAGDLTLNAGSATVLVNPLTAAPQNGSYRVIDYTGTLGGTFSADPVQVGRVTFQLNYSTAKQVNLTVTGGPAVARFVSTADGTWDTAGIPNWATNSSTSPNAQFLVNDTVVFDDLVAGVQTNISLNQAVIPGWTTNNSTANPYNITGTGGINGSGGLVKLGNSTLTLSTTNGFSGPVAIGGGTVKILSAANGLSSIGAIPGGTVTITNGSTLDLGGNPTANAINFTNVAGSKQFFIGGSGVGGNGAIINSVNTNQQNAFQLITLVANAAFGGVGRWDIRGGLPGQPVLDLAGFKLTKTGVNQISLVAPLVTSGDIDINQGVLSFETGSIVTNTGTITVNPGGAIGHFRQFAAMFTRPITLNGGAYTNLGGGGSTNDSPINVTADSTLSCLTGNDLYLRGPISGSFGLNKINSGTVIYGGTNSYTGSTVISAGTLICSNALPTNSSALTISNAALLVLNGTAYPLLSNHTLTNNGAVTNVPIITVGSGSTLTGNGSVYGNVTVGSGGTISGSLIVASNIIVNTGGTIAPSTNGSSVGKITGSISAQLAGTTLMKLNKLNPGLTNDLIASGGVIVYGGSLIVTNVGSSLVAGDTFQLFATSIPTSSFTNVTLPDPGAGLGWNTNSLYSGGTLSVVSTATGPTTNATITKATLSGTNLLVHGTNNNVPNTSFHYVVLTTANLTNPLSTWTPVVTNPFNPDGTFDYTNPIIPGNPRQFIDVKAVP